MTTVCPEIEHDIRAALSPDLVAEWNEKFGPSHIDKISYTGFLLRFAWRCPGAPVLAQRVIDWSNGQ
jgi:hypothetical protein